MIVNCVDVSLWLCIREEVIVTDIFRVNLSCGVCYCSNDSLWYKAEDNR